MKAVTYLRISADKSFPKKRKLHINHEIARNEVILKITQDRIIVKKPGLDYIGKINKFSKAGESGWHNNTISGYEINPGYYGIIEEETNEDVLVFDISETIDIPENIGFVKKEYSKKYRIQNAIKYLETNGYKIIKK